MSPELVDLLTKFGAPTALVFWLLWRFEPLLRAIPELIREQATAAIGSVNATVNSRYDRIESKLERQTAGIQNLRRAQLLYIMGHPSFPPSVKDQAKAMLDEPTDGNGQ